MLTAGTLTVERLLRTQAALRGDAPAVLVAGERDATVSLTYAALDAATTRLADALTETGIGAGDVVGLLLPNGRAFCVALLGAMRLGAVAMPIPTSSSPSEIDYILSHSGSRAVVCDATTQARVQPVLVSAETAVTAVMQFGDDADDAWRIDPVSARANGSRIGTAHEGPDHLRAALLLYTSGATARPKGILLSHQAIISAGLCNAWHQALTPADRHGIVLPMYHSNAMFLQFWAALVAGGSVYFGRRFDAATYWREMNAATVTVGDLVSVGIRALLRSDTTERAGPTRFMMYGLPMRDDELATFETRFGCPLIMVYGLTETAACGTRSPRFLDRHPDRIGLPMPGWEVRVLGELGNDCQPGCNGEIWLKGPSMFNGYLHDPDATRAAMLDGGLLTGDVGYFDDGGYLVFVDRKKDLIKVKGRSVASLEVEANLREHEAVADVAVLGVPDPETDERVVAFVVCSRNCEAEELRGHCARRLSWYKVPAEFIMRAELPKTSVGKVRKSELRAEFLAAQSGCPQVRA